MATSSRDHDSSSEDETLLRPIDIALEGVKHLKLGLGKIEAACCIYQEEYETIGHPYNTQVHPFNKYKLRSIFTRYCNRLTDKHLSKHCKVNLDLDDLKKATNPRMTQRTSEQVPVFSLRCNCRRKAFAALGFLLLIVPKFVSCYGFPWHFLSLIFFSYL